MPSPSQSGTTTQEPDERYAPYLFGEGQLPSWLTQAAPQMSPEMAADMAARAEGAEGSWLQAPPLGDYGGMTAPQQQPQAQAPQQGGGILGDIAPEDWLTSQQMWGGQGGNAGQNMMLAGLMDQGSMFAQQNSPMGWLNDTSGNFLNTLGGS